MSGLRREAAWWRQPRTTIEDTIVETNHQFTFARAADQTQTKDGK